MAAAPRVGMAVVEAAAARGWAGRSSTRARSISRESPFLVALPSAAVAALASTAAAAASGAVQGSGRQVVSAAHFRGLTEAWVVPPALPAVAVAAVVVALGVGIMGLVKPGVAVASGVV